MNVSHLLVFWRSSRKLAWPVTLREAPCVGHATENIPAAVQFLESGCDQGSRIDGSMPWLESAFAPVGILSEKITDASKSLGDATSCCFRPKARSPQPEANTPPAFEFWK